MSINDSDRTYASDTLAWFSNYGSVVDIAAPGVDILNFSR